MAGNGIGVFAIGVSGIGSPPTLDVNTTLLSQYANSPVITGLLGSISEWIDPAANLDNFFGLVWNLPSAEGYGLDIWGRIVGVTRAVQTATAQWFGFAEAGNASAEPFNQGVFYSGQPLTSQYLLQDDEFLPVIYAKAALNISNGSIPSINAILRTLFPNRGDIYVIDLGGRKMQCVVRFKMTAIDLAVLFQSGVLPRPAAVQLTTVFLPPVMTAGAPGTLDFSNPDNSDLIGH